MTKRVEMVRFRGEVDGMNELVVVGVGTTYSDHVALFLVRIPGVIIVFRGLYLSCWVAVRGKSMRFR